MGARVAHQLRRRIEPHGLTVEQRAGEDRGLVALEPGGVVHQQCKAHGVRLWKAVFTKSQHLLVDALRELLRVPLGAHALKQPLAKRIQSAAPLPGAHRAAQCVRLPRGKARRDDRYLHHLFLEDRYAQRAMQHLAHLLARILHRLRAAAAPQIGVHHVALDGTGAHDRDLDDEIVVTLRLQARQHGHLRARLDLEHADGVGARDHSVHARILGGQLPERVMCAAVVVDEREGTLERRQHPQRQQIHFQQPQIVEVVLVPLHHGALWHGRVLDGHQLLEQPFRDHEAADVLRQVARKAGEAHQLVRQRQQPCEPGTARIKPCVAHALRDRRAPIPPLHDFREPAALGGAETKDPGEVAQRAARPVHDDRGGERGAVATVLAVDVLQHLLAPLVLEIDVDVGRLVALARDEALEQQRRAPLRVHRGDPQAVAHARVGRRTSALTQNPLAARVGDDVLNGEEVRLVAQLGNERELVLDGGTLALRHTVGPAPARTLVRESAQVPRRGLPRRHELAGILVAQLLERETAPQCKLHRRLEQLARIQPREPRGLTQIALAVGVQP